MGCGPGVSRLDEAPSSNFFIYKHGGGGGGDILNEGPQILLAQGPLKALITYSRTHIPTHTYKTIVN